MDSARPGPGARGVRIGERAIAKKLATLAAVAVCGAGAASAQARPSKPPKPSKPAPPPVRVSVVQTTADLTERLAVQPAHTFGHRRAVAATIDVDDARRYQQFVGVGGAMTDSSAWLMWTQLPAARRALLMQALFGVSGARLGFLRVPVGASDFTVDGVPYTYDDGAVDPTLARFSIRHDQAYILPALRAARRLNPAAYVEAVPWTMPPWMKANQAFDNPGEAGALLAADYRAAAGYLVAFLQAYARAGVPVQALSPANEPGQRTLIPSMELSVTQEAQLISEDLLPALRGAHLSPTIFGWDLSWGPLTGSDPLVALARRGQIGLAYHCYQGSPQIMTAVHQVAPAASQIMDECATGSFDTWSTSEILIASFRNWAQAVGLWNLALNPAGGPVQPPNTGCPGCTGIVTIARGHFFLSRDYYELAQLSRFVTTGAWRVWSSTSATYELTARYTTRVEGGLDDVAFLDGDGTRVLVVCNPGTHPQRFNVAWRGRYIIDTVPAGATTTFTWRSPPPAPASDGGRGATPAQRPRRPNGWLNARRSKRPMTVS